MKDILAADKQLATEIEFDLKKWEEEQQKNAEKEARVSETPTFISILETRLRDSLMNSRIINKLS